MASFDELKSKQGWLGHSKNGQTRNHAKQGAFELSLEFYSKALEVSPTNHIILSNRSLALYKLEKYDLALEEAEKSIKANKIWAKGYIRKAAALNALGKHKEAKEACVDGFVLQDQSLCELFVNEWLKAGQALVDPKFDALKMPPWSDVLPEAANLFCDEYCAILHTVCYLRLSDAQSMSHETMTDCVLGAVEIAENVLLEFHHPSTVLLREWAKAATIDFESYPKSEWSDLIGSLHTKSLSFMGWLKNDVHKSLRLVLDPVIMLALSAMLVRGNILSQAYTGHHSLEYLGYACSGFFEQRVLTGPKYAAFHMAILSLILNSYRLRGKLEDSEVQLIRGLCHKLESLLPHLPKDHKNHQFIVQHYQHTVKVFREVCAKVVTEFTGSHDPTEALSELELALLKCSDNPDEAIDTAIKYLSDIASKTELSQSSGISHINFIDAENMLYMTGIFAKVGNIDQALHTFHSGESMTLSLLATVLERNTLSLDQLPSSSSICRQLVLSGAIWLKDDFPNDAADAFIRWKSFFTELRAILIRLGLRDCYREAFKSVETIASKGDGTERQQVQKSFQVTERQFFQKFSLSVIKAMYSHSYSSVAEALTESDVAIDYTFKIYNPEHHNPPQPQACMVVISFKKPPLVISISDELVYNLLQKWPSAIYKLWQSQEDEFKQISKLLSDILFPQPVRKVLLDPLIKRVFISPDADLMCFPIDQLPLHDDDDGSTLPLFERVSVSILSSPRELLRDETVKMLQDSSVQSTQDSSAGNTSLQEEASTHGDVDDKARQDELCISENQDSKCTSKPKSPNHTLTTDIGVAGKLTQEIANLQLVEPKKKCFIVANPDFQLECTGQPSSTWKLWLGSFGSLLGSAGQSGCISIQELKGSEKEAEEVFRLLHGSQKFEVYPPITKKKATISAILNLKSPHILHLATHGYSSKQESVTYHGNFWSDESSGILLAGAQTFLDKKFDKLDVKAGTGHMNCIAICGMQLEGTQLVYVSACDSSVGSRPSQEMPASITHAIRAAGAQTVISTLWSVSDMEATEFATCFYEHLMTHPECHPSEALSYAKAVMRRQGQSMFYWGAYMCHGIDCLVAP